MTTDELTMMLLNDFGRGVKESLDCQLQDSINAMYKLMKMFMTAGFTREEAFTLLEDSLAILSQGEEDE